MANARFIKELDKVRLEIPHANTNVILMITPDDALKMAAALKVALGQRENKTKKAKE